MKTRALVLIVGLQVSGASAAELPEVVFSRGALSLRRLPAVLSESTVARHLDTGLTTSLVFAVDAGRVEGRPVKGEAQARIRYDLWDERYLFERRDGQRDSPATATLARGELLGWWRSLTLVVLPAARGLRAPPTRAKVELLVLPFSQAEQRDAQDWLLRSFRSPDLPRQPLGSGQPSPEGAPDRAPLRDLYGAMLAASIGQRSLITYSWTVAVSTESP
jgi:hypothetical protein